jgi:molecular chaperone DnaK (HSP70)
VTAELQTRKMLSEVARRLGFPEFKVSNLCEEPVLASLLYVHIQEIAPEETILIYDLGGGTFDTAVIKVHKESTIRRPVLTVFASDGEAFCGGADIDEALFKHLVTKLAEEHLGFKSKESMEILQLMSPSEKQILRNYARDAKERLSEREEITIELPPAFLGEPQIILSVTRAELEGVVSRIELVDETLECVLRAWRRARMLLRKEGEPVGNFYLRYDPSSGCVDRSVLQLGHEDLRESVRRVLVVGGASKMPFIRQRLTSLWGAEKLVPEDVIPSVEAASQGAAWQEDEIGAIVDRLPFSIILRWDGGEHELYRAFTPIVSYEILTTSPKITPFTSNSLSLPSSCKEAVIVLRNAEEEPMCTYPLSEVPRGKSHLEIDMFGHCMLKNDLGTTIEFSNPSQHPIQRKALERLKEEERDREEERRQRSHEMLHRPPFLEND